MKKWVYLLRAFFPSWKFFDDVGTELRLEARCGHSENSGEHQMGEWLSCLPPMKRSLKNFVVNPRGNYLHACHNHLFQFSQEIMNMDATHVPDLPTYKITRNLVQHQLMGIQDVQPPFSYQFRLFAGDTEILTSPIFGN